MKNHLKKILPLSMILLIGIFVTLIYAGNSWDIQVWEMQEIILKAENNYQNYYTDVLCWVDLEGPNFSH
ncbi:MAG: hypothetical protein P8078_09950, partial [bacterium]